MEFKIGDVVALKSSPQYHMTVEMIDENGWCRCVWGYQTENREIIFDERSFPSAALQPKR